MTEILSATPVPPQGGQLPTAAAPQVIIVPPPPRRAGLIIVTILLVLSVLMNFLMMIFVAITSLAVMGGAGSAGPGKLRETVITPSAAGDKIAVIRIEGLITEQGVGGLFADRGTDVEFVKKQVDQALDDPHVKAIVLKVNSPGGGAAASDMMYHELTRLQDRKIPVVVHMGAVAASGGYYVAMAGQHIVAQRTCITGSIGVIGQLLTMREMLEEKVGVKVHTITSGPMKGVGSPFSDLTPEHEQYLKDTLIMPMYRQFLAVVKEGRPNLSDDRLAVLADGRAYSAQQALEDGLIDQIGFFDDAVMEAMKRAKLTAAKVVQYKRESGLFELLSASSQARSDTILNVTPDVLNAWSTPQVMMLWRGQ